MVKIYNKSGTSISIFGYTFCAGESKNVEIQYDENLKSLERQGLISIAPVFSNIPPNFGEVERVENSEVENAPTRKRRSTKQEITSDEDSEVNKIIESECE